MSHPVSARGALAAALLLGAAPLALAAQHRLSSSSEAAQSQCLGTPPRGDVTPFEAPGSP